MSDGSSKTSVVPCGKCAECRAKKQSEFSALALLESRRCSSCYFFTLTYNNDTVPIAKVVEHVRDGIGEIVFSGFVPDSKMRDVCVSYMKRYIKFDMMAPKSILPVSHVSRGRTPYASETEFDSVIYTPSLRREDVRLFIKRSRVAYEREYGSKIKCRYAFFGEYGSATKRPHYHGLIYDITPEQATFLSFRWKKEFGFCSFEHIPVVNADGSPARVKVANYVSKYIAKGEDDYPAVALNLVERPRRCSSRGFGVSALTAKEVENYKNFINAKT